MYKKNYKLLQSVVGKKHHNTEKKNQSNLEKEKNIAQLKMIKLATY